MVVWTQPQFKKNYLILSKTSPLQMIDSLLIAVQVFSRSKLISLSLDEILLPRYVNWFTYFRGIPFRAKIAPFLFKTRELRFIRIPIEVNASRCLLYVIQSRICSGSCIYEKCKIICVVWVCHSFSWISSTFCIFQHEKFYFIRFIGVRSTKSEQSINK